MAWTLGGLILALSGICYAYYLGTISARPLFFTCFLTLAMLILGGMRSITGAVIGTILITFD